MAQEARRPWLLEITNPALAQQSELLRRRTPQPQDPKSQTALLPCASRLSVGKSLLLHSLGPDYRGRGQRANELATPRYRTSLPSGSRSDGEAGSLQIQTVIQKSRSASPLSSLQPVVLLLASLPGKIFRRRDKQIHLSSHCYLCSSEQWSVRRLPG